MRYAHVRVDPWLLRGYPRPTELILIALTNDAGNLMFENFGELKANAVAVNIYNNDGSATGEVVYADWDELDVIDIYETERDALDSILSGLNATSRVWNNVAQQIDENRSLDAYIDAELGRQKEQRYWKFIVACLILAVILLVILVILKVLGYKV